MSSSPANPNLSHQSSSSRGSSSRIQVGRRPKLMRASATAPCLATSNASRNDLASLNPTSRASVMLSRVASYSSSQQDSEDQIQPSSSRRKLPSSRGCSPSSRNGSLGQQKETTYLSRISQGQSLLSTRQEHGRLTGTSGGYLLQLSKFRGLSRGSRGRKPDR
jgi:hypothetical protein